MCNEIKCAIQYTVDLINNNINRDVQEQCANMAVPGMYTLKFKFARLTPGFTDKA